MLTVKDQFFLTPLGQWVLRHKKALSITAFAALGLLAWQGVLELRSSKENEKPLEEIFSAWKKEPESEALFIKLKQAAKETLGPHPIHAEIAQVLLTRKRADEARSMALFSLKQLKNIAPDYAEFSEISLLISRKNYQEALERAVSLKEALQDRESILYGKNLVRIAFIQQQLQNSAGETAAWREWEEFPKFQNQRKILQGLSRRESDFQAYLEERKKRV